MSSRRHTDTTGRPPPPDPLDAAHEARERARASAAELADADDEEELTGRVDTLPSIHVHIDADGTGRHAPLTSFHDEDVPKKSTLGTWLAVAGTVATIVAAIAHALGLV